MEYPSLWFTLGAIAVLWTLGYASILVFTVFSEAFPIFQAEGWNLITGTEWIPEENHGGFPIIFGSVAVTSIALAFAVPLAWASAVFTAECLEGRLRLFVKAVMELLAGIPGIIYGLVGMVFLSPWIKNTFHLIDGNTLLTAGLLLGVMILPVLMTLAEDAVRAVPEEYRATALALGLTRWETLRSVTLPQARSGLMGALFLGMGRALGETVAVLLVIGSLDRLPSPWYNMLDAGQNIPAKLGREAAESLGYGLQWNALMGLGALLFIVAASTTILGNRFLGRIRT